MIRFSELFLVALLASAIPCAGGPLPSGLKATVDGSVHVQPALGTTKWTGAMKIEHRRFNLEVRGCTSIFTGPSIRKTQGGRSSLRMEDLTVDFDWISLVALGDVVVTVPGANGPSRPVKARSFVYVPAKDRILIDGVPWADRPAEPDARP